MFAKFALAALFAMAGESGGVSTARAQPRAPRDRATPSDATGLQPGCEPYTQMFPVDIPSSQRAVCGDGRARRGKRSCWRECASGCPGVSGCEDVECLEGRELCDGRDLAGATCASQGFAGGTLRCSADCGGFDVSGCRACVPGPNVRCGSLPLGVGIGAPILAENGTDVAVGWTSGSAGGQTLHFARIEESGRAVPALLPLADAHGEIALAGGSGGFLFAFASSEGTFVARLDRDGALMATPRRVADEADALELVRLEALADGAGIAALFLGHGPEPRALYLDADGTPLDAPPRGLVFHGVGARTRVFIVPFPHIAAATRVSGDVYETEAASGDTVIARVLRGRAIVQVLRAGQPFGGRIASGAEVDVTLGRDGTGHLVMREADGMFQDTFTPPSGATLSRSGARMDAAVPNRALARHASIRFWTTLEYAPGSHVEAALLGTPGAAESLAVARVRTSARARRTRRGAR